MVFRLALIWSVVAPATFLQAAVVLQSVDTTGPRPNVTSDIRTPRLALQSKKIDREVRHWIDQLAASDYESRTQASSYLGQLGSASLDPLFQAIHSNDFEKSFRAIKIIKKIGLNGDLPTLELIIRKSQSLPTEYQGQFESWSLGALANWKSNQSRLAVERLITQGASVSKLDGLGQMELMIIDDLEEGIRPLKENRQAESVESVLDEIQRLKKELAGEVVQRKPREQSNNQQQQAIARVEMGGRIIGRGEAIIVRPAVPAAFSPQNVTFGNDWKGEAAKLNDLRFVSSLNQVEFVEQEITSDILRELQKIGNLKSLRLTRCEFDFSELKEFKAKRDRILPLQLMATGAGYLGVYGDEQQEVGTGSYVTLVSPDSAASEAGLERGDLIFQVDGDPIASFAELSLVISSKPIGKVVKISVRRNGSVKELNARLKSRAGIR